MSHVRRLASGGPTKKSRGTARKRDAAALRKRVRAISCRRFEWIVNGVTGVRVFAVVLPLGGILGDVKADGVEVGGGADDVFVVVALPDGAGAMKCAIDGGGGKGFEGAKNQSERERSFRRGAACCARGRERPETKNAVDVIGHDHEGVEFNGWETHRKSVPNIRYGIAGHIAFHFVIVDAPEDGFMAQNA